MAKAKSFGEMRAERARMEAAMAEQRERTAKALGDALVDDDVMELLDGMGPSDLKKRADGRRPALFGRAGGTPAAEAE